MLGHCLTGAVPDQGTSSYELAKAGTRLGTKCQIQNISKHIQLLKRSRLKIELHHRHLLEAANEAPSEDTAAARGIVHHAGLAGRDADLSLGEAHAI
jgi:hypothetical protein